MKKQNNEKPIIAVGIVLFVFGIAAMSYALLSKDDPQVVSTTNTVTSSNSKDVALPVDNSNATDKASTESQLLYLIEEEKLAHDVYTVMYQKYGARVFGNILKSEETHQGRVLTLLQARNIADPRSEELGVFKNQELQTLYNQLIEQGNKSEVEAYKVGVIIEEKDIADISAQLATATEQDVISTLEDLRRGSESHLRAFNRQL